ncbi:MAG TPA: DUF3426 domain-containing protein [Deltaproteobacteria bacterium]|nr:DUF3426 domain-containing protein [Deltaproteobacteria bacterium]HPR54823.1 DUF3426 domain-containing protein [Deltaproteobacteria bacterium]HXK46552.1 DUF3426 domain-containing protein [Deltaproteobacteria bacterium]
MIIVHCPNCHSKFRFSHDGLGRNTLKMRCSVCKHVFEYTIEPEVSLDQEFDMLLSSKTMPEQTPEPEAPGGGFDQEIEETTEETTPPEETQPGEPAATESVIREIDSLLGSATEVERELEEPYPEEAEEKKSHLKVAALIVCLLIIAMASLWLFKDKILFFEESRHEATQAAIEKGPFFNIDENLLTYEVLNHEQEGSVLVIKGSLRKITPKPVESVMVEARVYGKDGGLIESRLAYAGIVPDLSEFTKQPQRDIDALLTSDPASPGSTLPSGEIPFAVAFFGKPAQEGASFKVEVKELRWK